MSHLGRGRQPGRPVGIWTRIRDAFELLFESWGHLVYRRAWATIGITLVVVIALASQLSRLEVDTSTEGFLPEGDSVRLAYDSFREQFGRDEIIVLAVRGPEVFDLVFLDKLRALHEEIEAEVPYLEDITSLVNARHTRGIGDELVVGDFLEDWPETAEELETLRRQALSNPLYINQLISTDGRLTTVLIETDAFSSVGISVDELAGFDGAETAEQTKEERPFITGEENTQIVTAIRAVVERHQSPDFGIYMAGNPVMIDQVMRAMLADMGLFAGLALIAISLLLALLFRSLRVVALSLVVSVLAVICSLAVMGLIGMPLTSPTQIMPSFLLAVGVGNSVHVLVIYLQARGRGDDVEAALVYALGHSGLAIVMTALTTAGGLLSFLTAEIAPVADVGVICPIGTLIALVFSLVLLPALIAVVPIDVKTEAGSPTFTLLRNIPIRCGDLGTRYPVMTCLLWGLILSLSLLGAMRVGFSHDPIKWFAVDHPLRLATELINEELSGSISLEVLVDSGRLNGLQDPDLLKRMDAMQRHAEQVHVGELFVGKTVSLADVTKEIHQALNENRAEYYAIPEDRNLVAQELLLFENSGSDDLEDVVDSQFRVGRLTLKLPMVDAIGFDDLFLALEPRFNEILGDAGTYTITGVWSILGRTIIALVDSLSRTYVMAFAIIAPLMIILLGSLRLGLLSMIPNVSAILVTLGFMGWSAIPLDAFTLMVGSIALGLAVDDTIHFMHNFRRAYGRLGDAQAAVRMTLESTGQALFFTSLVLTTGFFIYMFAAMKNLFYFGLLTGIAIAVAFLANVTLTPALVTLVARSGGLGAPRGEEEAPQ